MKIIFDQFLLIPTFLKWEFGRTLENLSIIPFCLDLLSNVKIEDLGSEMNLVLLLLETAIKLL